MKKETDKSIVVGISFSKDLLKEIDKRKMSFGRSTFVCAAVAEYLKKDAGEIIKAQLDYVCRPMNKE